MMGLNSQSRYPRFEPVTPSRELAALIRQWAYELVHKTGVPEWLVRLCRHHDSIPLHGLQLDLWVLRPDGQVLWIDLDSYALRAEPETNPETAYAVLAQGTRDHPELRELLSTVPAGFRQCEQCSGVGWTQARPPATGADSCTRCNGLGSYVPRANVPNPSV